MAKTRRKKRRENRIKKIISLRNEVEACTACKLYKRRNQLVFGEGNVLSRLVFIGEAPGEKEDLYGRPFVGKAGKILRRIIRELGHDPKEDVFICNILKCRPPKNRNPLPREIKLCTRWLDRQLEILRPNIVVPLGNFATQYLLNTKIGVMKLRGKMKIRGRLRIFPTVHPAWLARNQTEEAEQGFREDLEKAFLLSREKPNDAPSWYTKLRRREA